MENIAVIGELLTNGLAVGALMFMGIAVLQMVDMGGH